MKFFLPLPTGSLLPVDLLKDLQDLDEEVDNVQVELDGGHDVLLSTQPGHNHLQKGNSINEL